MLVMAEDAATIRAKKKKKERERKKILKKRRKRRRRDPTIIGERELATIKDEEEEGEGRGRRDDKRSKRRWKNAVGEQENSFEVATLERREVFPQGARTYV